MKFLTSFTFVLLILFTSCGDHKNLNDHMDIQGHRGCRGLMPENTIPGFVRALESGVNTLEMDVSISADHKVVVSHDPFFHHNISTGPDQQEITKETQLNHNLYKLDYDSIAKYDVGLKTHPNFPIQRKIPTIKPLLSEVIQKVEALVKNESMAPVQYSIELKRKKEYDNIYHPDGHVFSDLVIDVVDRPELVDRVILQCFDVETLQIIRKKKPNISLAYLIEESTDYQKNIDTLGFIPEIYSPYYKLVDKQLVDYCKSQNMKLIPWTINDPEDLQKLMLLGVDGVISDYPDRAIEVYEGLKMQKH